MQRFERNKKYSYVDGDEKFWFFVYGMSTLTGETGWHAFFTYLGSPVVVVMGVISEQELSKRYERFACRPEISGDDMIDLNIWLKEGGLEQFMSGSLSK